MVTTATTQAPARLGFITASCVNTVLEHAEMATTCVPRHESTLSISHLEPHLFLTCHDVALEIWTSIDACWHSKPTQHKHCDAPFPQASMEHVLLLCATALDTSSTKLPLCKLSTYGATVEARSCRCSLTTSGNSGTNCGNHGPSVQNRNTKITQGERQHEQKERQST